MVRWPRGQDNPVLTSPAVRQTATRLGVTPPQVALQWLLQLVPNVLLIPGTGSVAHLRENLLTDALRRYCTEHHHLPARVVLHKTSSYTDDEIAGFRAAADHADVDMLEMLWLPADDPVRLFRSAATRNPAQR